MIEINNCILKSYSKLITSLLLLGSIIGSAYGQKNQFSIFNNSTGFENDYVYDIAQDSMGHIWFATGSGLIKLDDNKSTLIPTTKDLKEHLLYSIDIGKKSLWLGGKNGFIANYSGAETEKIICPFTQRVISIGQLDSNNTIFISENEGVYIYDKNADIGQHLTNEELGLSKIISAKSIKNRWYISTKKNMTVFEYKNGSLIPQNTYKDLRKVNDFIFLDESTMLAGSERKGLLLVQFNENRIIDISTTLSEELKIENSIKHILKDEDDSFWISTFGQGVIEVKLNKDHTIQKVTTYDSKTGLNSNFINKTFQDYEGNIWICSYGNGVFYKARDYVRLVPFNFNNININSVHPFRDGVIFSASNSVYYSPNEQQLETILQTEIKEDIITRTVLYNQDTLIYALEGKGLFGYSILNKKHFNIEYSNSRLSKNINDILVSKDSSIWLATFNGVHKTNIKGDQLIHHTTQTGLRHNLCKSLAQKDDNTILVGSKSNRLSIIKEDSITELKIPGINPSMIISQIHVVNDENIWLATLGSGLFQIKKDTILNFHKSNGLQDNFIFNIQELSKDYMLIIHERGIGKINTNNYSIDNFSNKYGIASKYTVNSSTIANQNIVWGATGGIVLFNPKKYFSKSVKPKIGFSRLFINDTIVNSLGKQTIELPYGEYKIMLDYKGVSFSNGDNVKYSYFLNGYDEEWHDGQTLDMAVYKKMSSGNYTFQIRACLNGLCEEKTSNFSVLIDKPIWKKAWFIVLVSALLISFITIAFYLQAQANKRKKRILEYNIELKTKELKLKNQHIISSITYAKRIQDAVMPNKSILENSVFVPFSIELPKDIVGGDFIWQANIDNKLYVALCDCTGHGVPGGFMTILSANLLANTIIEKKIQEPNKILDRLNDQVLAQLHDSSENQVHDGMDMSLVVIDFEANKISYCAANRPFFLNTKSAGLKYIKGTRKSIGDDSRKSEYEVTHYNIDDVEAFYLYSDGFVDQFGGEDQSKYGRKRLMQQIEDGLDLPAKTQESILQSSIENWKSTHEFQLDDITLLGFIKK